MAPKRRGGRPTKGPSVSKMRTRNGGQQEPGEDSGRLRSAASTARNGTSAMPTRRTSGRIIARGPAIMIDISGRRIYTCGNGCIDDNGNPVPKAGHRCPRNITDDVRRDLERQQCEAAADIDRRIEEEVLALKVVQVPANRNVRSAADIELLDNDTQEQNETAAPAAQHDPVDVTMLDEHDYGEHEAAPATASAKYIEGVTEQQPGNEDDSTSMTTDEDRSTASDGEVVGAINNEIVDLASGEAEGGSLLSEVATSAGAATHESSNNTNESGTAKQKKLKGAAGRKGPRPKPKDLGFGKGATIDHAVKWTYRGVKTSLGCKRLRNHPVKLEDREDISRVLNRKFNSVVRKADYMSDLVDGWTIALQLEKGGSGVMRTYWNAEIDKDAPELMGDIVKLVYTQLAPKRKQHYQETEKELQRQHKRVLEQDRELEEVRARETAAQEENRELKELLERMREQQAGDK